MYWTFLHTLRDYSLNFIITDTHAHNIVHIHVFISCCSVEASGASQWTFPSLCASGTVMLD
jgi:hypothetical protein